MDIVTPDLLIRRSRLRALGDILIGKIVTLLLAAGAIALGIATFVLLSGGLPIVLQPRVVVALMVANLTVLLVLGALLAARITRVWVERRRGFAGSRLHIRLVLLFAGVAIVPTIVVAVFAAAFFNLGIQAWFNDRVRTALQESLKASQGYLEEHRNNIRADALGMANDLSRAGRILVDDPDSFAQMLAAQTALRGLMEAVIFEPVTGQVVASAGVMGGLGTEAPPAEATELARNGEVAVLDAGDGTRVRAIVQLNAVPPLMLLIDRPIDTEILDHMHATERVVADYDRLDQNRFGLQITFIVIFALVALLVLCAAVLIGLVMATQIARPIGRLILAAERVRSGDLDTRVPETAGEDEMAGLSRAFNRMTGQLSAQRSELMDAYRQIDERRRFTETVLSGVSAGVIGLDAEGLIELPNHAASELVGRETHGRDRPPARRDRAGVGRPDRRCHRRLCRRGRASPKCRSCRRTRKRILIVRIGADRTASRTSGFVVTFDDITELQAAQRTAAWADVARRIAHEIKNPLTPIQLSAERLKRRFTKEITSDPETFTQCADTIVRHVGDIGRMVDEFSAFARMPQPVMRLEDVGRIARDTLVLQRAARPEIAWDVRIPDAGPIAMCDRRLIGQALTNLVQNATDAIAMRPRAETETGADNNGAGHICVDTVEAHAAELRIAVADDGVGLPEEDRERLTEPYVTHKAKGTGLGLAIVRKIMEDHGGGLTLEDRPGGPGAVAVLILPFRPAAT